MKIGQKLGLGVAGIVCLLALAGGFGIAASGRIIDAYSKSEERLSSVVQTAYRILSLSDEQQSFFSRYLMMGQDEDRQAFFSRNAELRSLIQALASAEVGFDNPEVTEQLQTETIRAAELAQALLKTSDPRERKDLVIQFHNACGQVGFLAKSVITHETTTLIEQELFDFAAAVVEEVERAEHTLNLALLTEESTHRGAVQEQLFQLRSSIDTLSTRAVRKEHLPLMQAIEDSFKDLEGYTSYLLRSLTDDLTLLGSYTPSHYQKSAALFYQTASLLRRDARAIANLSAEALKRSQEREVAGARAIQYSILFAITFSLIVASILAFRITTLISRPIHKLQRAVELYAKGKLQREIEVESGDEIGALAKAFNKMTKSLQESMVSRSFVTDIIESMPESLFVLHPDLRIKLVNRAVCELLGYTAEELIDQPIHILFASHSPLRNGTVEQFIERSKSRDHEETFVTKGQREISVLFSASPITGDSRKIEELVCSAKDITALKQADSQVKRSLKKLSDVMFALDQSAILMITDSRGIISHVNDQYCALSQFSRQELIGRQHGLTDPETHAPTIIDVIWTTISAGKVWKGDLKYRRKDGSDYWVSNTIVPFLDDSNEPFQYLAISFDITERKRVERQIIDAKQAAEESSQAKSSFLAKMSHELRTPLNAILGYCELLEEEFEDEGHEEHVGDLKKIHSAGNHLLALINDILDLSKIESGKMEVYIERFKARTMIEEVVATIRPLVAANNNRLIVECADNVEEIQTDFVKMKQVLINLLSNACKFTENGEISLSAQRSVTPAGDHVAFAIKDTGTGIPKDKLQTIFEAFTQADSSTTRKYGGTGLGLAITSKFTSMLGGQIGVTSQIDEGSTFTVEIPSVYANPVNESDAESAEEVEIG